MAKGIYVGVSDKARKVKKLYVGVNNVARKVKKVYIGDANGKARLAWTGLPVSAMQPLTNIDGASYYGLGAATIGDYSIFLGNAGVCGYNIKTLTRVSVAWDTAYYPVGCSNGKYAAFAGRPSTPHYMVVYDASLTHSTVQNRNDNNAHTKNAACSLANKSIFFGASSTITLDQSLTYGFYGWVCRINEARHILAATIGSYAICLSSTTKNDDYNIALDQYGNQRSVGAGTYILSGQSKISATFSNKAVFGPSTSSPSVGIGVEHFNSSLTRGNFASSKNGYYGAAAVVGNYYLITGGSSSTSEKDAIDTAFAYNTSFTLVNAPSLKDKKCYHAATGNGEYAIFGGGYGVNGLWNGLSSVDVYTKDLDVIHST